MFTFDVMSTAFPKPKSAPWGAIASAVGSVASSLIGGGVNANLNARTRNWQNGQRVASQEYQTAERIAQNQYAESMYNKYSSPQAMARQYAEAGLNPRLAADGSSVGSATSGSGSNGGAPSGASAPAPAYMDMPSISSSIAQVAGALASLGDAKKSGVETQRIETLLNEELRSAVLRNDAQEFTNLFMLPLEKLEKIKGIDKLITEIANGKLNGEQIKQAIHGMKLDNKIKQNELDHWLENYEANLAHTNAETENLNADTNVKNEMPEYIRSNTRLNGIKYHEVKASIENLFTHADLNRSLARLTGLQGDQLEEFKPYLLDEIISRVENMDANTQLTFGRELNQSLRNTNLQMLGTEEFEPKTTYGQFSYDAQGQVRSTLGHSITTAKRNFHEDKPEYHHKPRAHDKDTHSSAKAVPHKKYDKKP